MTILLTSENINDSLNKIIRTIQVVGFAEKIQLLKQGQSLPHTKKISRLSPFLDDNIVRVGGQLDSSNLPFEAKHPVLLSYNYLFVQVLMKIIHEKTGNQVLLTIPKQRFWP